MLPSIELSGGGVVYGSEEVVRTPVGEGGYDGEPPGVRRKRSQSGGALCQSPSIMAAQLGPVGSGWDGRAFTGGRRPGLHAGQRMGGADRSMGRSVGQVEGGRAAERIGRNVRPVARPTARALDRLVPAESFRALAPCWRAWTMVLLSSACSLPASAAGCCDTRARTPDADQRLNR